VLPWCESLLPLGESSYPRSSLIEANWGASVVNSGWFRSRRVTAI
jgi:hypothetical protein